MGAMTAAERARYETLRVKLEKAVVSVVELRNGYAFRLALRGIGLLELEEWMRYEKRCCSFFELEIEAEGEDASLMLTGPEGVKAFIRAEFVALKIG
jgi:hypothetical protein